MRGLAGRFAVLALVVFLGELQKENREIVNGQITTRSVAVASEPLGNQFVVLLARLRRTVPTKVLVLTGCGSELGQSPCEANRRA